MVSSVAGIMFILGQNHPVRVQKWAGQAMYLRIGCPNLRIDTSFACLNSLTKGRSRS